MKIAPSILASDMSNFTGALEICEQGGAELVHVDVMDGHFVPNLTFGPPVIAALRDRTDLLLDVHLMVSNPARLLDQYLEQCDWVSFHWEAEAHVDRLVQRIQEAGCRAGVVLNPATPVEVVYDVLPELDFVLLMSVNPGFGGQAFRPYVLDKCRRLRETIDERGLAVEIEIDGGVKEHNALEIAAVGVDVAVIGSGIFAAADPVATLNRVRELVAKPESAAPESSPESTAVS
jgi:ribulose-phosphate 3-epimerase